MKTVAPKAVGFESSRLDRIKHKMQAYVDEGKLAGVITVVARRGQIAHAECVGWMDVEAEKTMQFDTIFRLHSMTKPITSVATMMLYEQGHLQLYDPVSNFIPAFKEMSVLDRATEAGLELCDLERPITVRDLLVHTSGLSSGFGADRPLAQLYQEAGLNDPTGTLEERARALASMPLLHQPGEAWRYSQSYDVLAHLVEVISGMPFADFLRQQVFEPLGMEDTGFYLSEGQLDRLAVYYGPSDEGGFRVVDDGSRYASPPTLTSGGGGLLSTASDYLRFAQMMLNGGELEGIRLLGSKTARWMAQNHLPQKLVPIQIAPGTTYFAGHGYGLGFSVMMSTVEHQGLGSVGEYGWGGYAGTEFWVDPEEALIGLFMPQLEPMAYFPMRRAFRTLTYQAIVD